MVVDDINLIKKNKQLDNLEKILEILPAEKQNIVYTNRRSKETQSVLEKILKAPEEIKVDKAKEQEAAKAIQQPAAPAEKPAKQNNKNQKNRNKPARSSVNPQQDPEAMELAKKYNSFNGRVPEFILNKGILADDNGSNACNIEQNKISTPY